jgi:hypothetical protein
VQTSTGWQDVGGGGAGSITSIDSPDGSLDITNPGGPVVSIEVDPANVTVAGQATGPLTATKVVGITETSGPTALTIGAINNFQLLQRVGATVVGTAYPATTLVGDVNGPIISNQVNAIHETSGPTQLTIGAVATGTSLTRSGSTLVGVSKVNSDFGTYSAKGSPGPLDSLVINDFAAGGAVKVTFISDITNSIAPRPPSQYWAAATSPSTIDDPFLTGSSDMATRGWTCIMAGTGVAATRAGDILPYTNGNVSCVGNTYRSTLTASGMLIQTSTEVWFYKTLPVSLQSGSVSIAVDFFGCSASNNTGNSTRFGLAAGPVPNYTTTRQLWVEYWNGVKNQISYVPPSAFTNINSTGTATPASNFHATETIIDSLAAGANQTYKGVHIDPLTGGILNYFTSSAFPTANWITAGFNVQCNVAGLSWMQFRGFRVAASGTFPML